MPIQIPRMPEAAPGTLEMLAAKLGTALPSEYITFVKLHDGATPADNVVELASNNASGVRKFISANEALTEAGSIDGFPANKLVLAEDGCGNYFYIDVDTGAVFFWDHEWEGDQRVAAGLDAFLRLLEPFDVSSVKLTPGQVKSVWVDPNFKPEF